MVQPIIAIARVVSRMRLNAGEVLGETLHGDLSSLDLDSALVSRRHEDLSVFQDRYEEFVAIVCDAAQYGPSPQLRAEYLKARSCCETDYQQVRSFVSAYLPPDEAHFYRLEPGRAADAFEELFNPSTVDDFLDSDNGDMIQRIIRTREALNLYGEHLRQLSARMK